MPFDFFFFGGDQISALSTRTFLNKYVRFSEASAMNVSNVARFGLYPTLCCQAA